MQVVEITHCCGHVFGGFTSDEMVGSFTVLCPKCKQLADIRLSLLNLLHFKNAYVSPLTEGSLTFEIVDATPVRLPKTKELIMSKERNVTFGVTYNDPDKEELSYQSIDVKFTGEIEPNVLLSEAIAAIQQRLYDAVNGKILTTTLRKQP